MAADQWVEVSIASQLNIIQPISGRAMEKRMTPAEILAARKRLGLTQRQLADALDVDPMTVSRWKRGTREAPPLLRAALDGIEAVTSN